jgi:general secretion pathway protein N
MAMLKQTADGLARFLDRTDGMIVALIARFRSTRTVRIAREAGGRDMPGLGPRPRASRTIVVGFAASVFAMGAAAAAAATVPEPLESRETLAGSERPQTGNPLWAISLRVLTVTRERPIFSPSRRPRPPPVVAVPQAPPLPPPPAKPVEPDHPLLSLVGTVTGEGRGFAIFLEDSTKNVLRLRVGEDYAGWVLRAVERRDARFEKNDRSATLSLPPPAAPQSPIPAGPPPPALSQSPSLIGPPPTPVGAPPGVSTAAAANTWIDSNGKPIAPSRSRYSRPNGGPAATPAQSRRAN